MKTKIKPLLVFFLIQLQSFSRNADVLKVVSPDLTVIAFFKSGQSEDSTSIEVSIQNNSDSNYLFINSDFSGNLNFENAELYCFITNIIAENCGKVILDGIKPQEVIKINFPIKNFYGFENGIGRKLMEKKYIVVEVNYLTLTPGQNIKNESKLSFGRIYFLDQSKRLLLSNYR